MLASQNRSSLPTPRRRTWLSRNVVVLGLVSLFNDAASEMVIPLLPAFLTAYLGSGALALGAIEGGADAVSSLLKLAVGRAADRLGRYRPFVLAGYALSATVRPLVGLAVSPVHVLAVRVADRTGKGIRTSPRDALIAATVRPDERGAAFGLHRAMDHGGAVLGPALALLVLELLTRDLRVLFLVSALPGVLAVLLVAFGTSEAPARAPATREPVVETPTGNNGALLRFLGPLALFTLGNASDVFLLMRAGEARASLETLPVLWMVLHVVKALVSLGSGHLADRLGAQRIVTMGWVVYAIVYVLFAFAPDPTTILVLFLVYGAYHGLTEGPERALVAHLAPRSGQGTAFGWYHLVLGILGLVSSLLFGALWEAYGSRTAFLTSAGLAVAAAIWLRFSSIPDRLPVNTRE